MGDEALQIKIPSDVRRDWMAPVEDMFSYFGLTTPLLRLTGVTVAVSVALFWMKPPSLFENDGEPKPWILWGTNGVTTPWWLVALLLGLASATFV
jgi:hypothetical protein